MAATTERAYMPHIWIQQTGFGPKVWAGEIVDGQRRIRTINPRHNLIVQVRFARLDKAGFDELTALLQDDIRTLTGAA